MKTKKQFDTRLVIIMTLLMAATLWSQRYKIVDTGQIKFYNNSLEINTPALGAAFYGQDAQYHGNQPSYTDNGDGTITDNVTGLMWQKSPDMDGDGNIDAADKLSYDNAMAGTSSFNLAGYNDWHLPTIKELYSIMMFYGEDPSGYNGSSTNGLIPFINTNYFDFGYGDTNAGERIIDAQFASATLYVSTTMNGNETMFGLNLADGRIKGYPTGPMPGSNQDKGYYVLYVRGNTAYGINNFSNNNDGTITDNATNLMWQQDDSQNGLNWEEALAWAQQKNAGNYLGHSDWRLPDAKELQSLLDYTRSPATTNSAAIDPLFNCSAITNEGGHSDYAFYWSSTTHANMQNGSNAAYISFGEALGYWQYSWTDVHGAGAQRSDPKSGDPANWPTGHGPQGDAIRIYNYVRLVRDVGSTAVNDQEPGSSQPDGFTLEQNYPNPFNPETTITFLLTEPGLITLSLYDTQGRKVRTLLNENITAGQHSVNIDLQDLPSGHYLYCLEQGQKRQIKACTLIK